MSANIFDMMEISRKGWNKYDKGIVKGAVDTGNYLLEENKKLKKELAPEKHYRRREFWENLGKCIGIFGGVSLGIALLLWLILSFVVWAVKENTLSNKYNEGYATGYRTGQYEKLDKYILEDIQKNYSGKVMKIIIDHEEK